MTLNKVQNFIAIDVGNSLIKTFIINGNEHIYKQADNWDSIKKEIHEYLKTDYHVIISQVNSIFMDDIRNTFKQNKFLILNNTTPLPIKNNYKTPETLGYDRIAAAVGAFEHFPTSPCLIIDAGTAITVDLMYESSFMGGCISPGIEMRFRALHQFTNKLPLLTKSTNFDYPGKSTEESIYNGVIQGVVFELEKRIEDFQKSYPNGKIIITGGDGFYLVKLIKKTIFAEPELVLKGLINILKYNVL